MSLTIDDGGQVSMDPNDALVYQFDWSDNLTAGVLISVSNWAITVVRGTAGLTYDNGGKSVQTTHVRLRAGVLGSKYQVTNQIVTNETVPQTKERSFLVLMENL